MKYIVPLLALGLLFSSCDDTRAKLHEKYLEFVMHTDNLDSIHDAMTAKHQNLKKKSMTLEERLADLEMTDSAALVDLKEHQGLLNEQAAKLKEIQKILSEHQGMNDNMVKDSDDLAAATEKIEEINAANEKISANLNKIQEELNKIHEDQQEIEKDMAKKDSTDM
ncbi:MAG: hypothetical protein CL868_05125 [Cytophagaceae bacterium]|nr:hypothetical protein [Cytophagaceae bacterium]